MMAIFIARISRGRSAREIIILMSVIAPLLTMAWFSILGGTGLGLEMANAGTITEPFEGFNLPAVLLAITQSMPFNAIVSFLFLILTALFVATYWRFHDLQLVSGVGWARQSSSLTAPVLGSSPWRNGHDTGGRARRWRW
jgi:choline-glycine betaine transporter